MTNKLINSRLSAITPNTSDSFVTWLTANWSQTTGYTVPASPRIDTKFGSTKGAFYYVIVEEMPKSIKPQTVGNGRYNNTEVKRIQILCIDPTAKTIKYNMEKHIESLVNGNPTGMQTTYGIDTISLSEFVEIPTSEDDNTITNLQPNTGFQKARSRATLSLRFETETSSI